MSRGRFGRCVVMQGQSESMTRPPIHDPGQIGPAAIDDMRDACHLYLGDYGMTEAFDRVQTEHGDYIAQVANGTIRGVEPVDRMVEWLLRPWHSIRNFPESARAAVADGLSRAQDLLGQLPSALALENADDEHIATMAEAYDALARCKYFGGTNASKSLAALRPELFPMWDDKIAQEYGFCRYNGAGYRRFVALQGATARRLRELWTDSDQSLEDYIQPAGRKWKAPIAKLIDEWNWIRIVSARVGIDLLADPPEKNAGRSSSLKPFDSLHAELS